MSKFSVGDRVKCVDKGRSEFLVIGNEYTVETTWLGDGVEYLSLCEASANIGPHSYRQSCFGLVSPPAPAPAQPAAWVPGVGDEVELLEHTQEIANEAGCWDQGVVGSPRYLAAGKNNIGKHFIIEGHTENKKPCVILHGGPDWPIRALKLIRRASEPAKTVVGVAGDVASHHGTAQAAAPGSSKSAHSADVNDASPAHHCPLCSGPCEALPPFMPT